MKYFLDTDFGNDWKVYFIWGHSHDMSNVSYSSYTYTTNSYFTYFTKTCELAAQNAGQLWNPTPLDFVDYVNASRLTQVTEKDGKISIYNPSSCIDVWMTVDGTAVKIAAGETVEI